MGFVWLSGGPMEGKCGLCFGSKGFWDGGWDRTGILILGFFGVGVWGLGVWMPFKDFGL